MYACDYCSISLMDNFSVSGIVNWILTEMKMTINEALEQV